MSVSETQDEGEPGQTGTLSRSPPKLSQLHRAASSTPPAKNRSTGLLHSSDLEEEEDSDGVGSWKHQTRLSRISLDRLRLAQRAAALSANKSSPRQPLHTVSPGRFPDRRTHPTASTSSSTLVDPETPADASPRAGKIKHPSSRLDQQHLDMTASLTHTSPARSQISLKSTHEESNRSLDSKADHSVSARIHDTFDRVLRNSALSPPNVPDHKQLLPSSSPSRAPVRPKTSEDDFGQRASTRLRDYYADDSDQDLPEDGLGAQQYKEKENGPSTGKLAETPSKSRLWRRSSLINSPVTPHLPGFLQSTPARPQSAPLSSSTPREPPPSTVKTPRFPGAYHTTTPGPTHRYPDKGKSRARDESESPHLAKESVDGLSEYLHRVRQRSVSEELADVGPSSTQPLEPSKAGVRFATRAGDSAAEVKQEEDDSLPASPQRTNPPNSLHERLRSQRAAQKQRSRSFTEDVKPDHQDLFSPQINKAEQLDAELRERAEEVRQTVEEVGARLSAKLTDAVGLTLKRDARRRTRWLLFAFLGELVLLLAIFGAAMARARQEYLSSYYDPFTPHLQSYPSLSTMAASSNLVVPAETLVLFAPPSNNPPPPGWHGMGMLDAAMHHILEWAAKLIVSSWASTTWDASEQSFVMPT